MTHVPLPLRNLVAERAQSCCEYCHYPQEASMFAFEMEHIIAEKHGGKTVAENLALSCPYCNRAKGTDLGSIDPETGELTAFYNPRAERWSDHFSFEGAQIIPLSAVGRVTVLILQMNAVDRLAERERLVVSGVFPQQFDEA